MSEYIRMSESEYEVMEVIWAKNDKIGISEIWETLSKNKKWAYNTVGTFVIRLTEKGLLHSQRKSKANLYIPLISKTEYKQIETQNFLRSIHDGSKASLIASLYGNELPDEKIELLIQMLEGDDND